MTQQRRGAVRTNWDPSERDGGPSGTKADTPDELPSGPAAVMVGMETSILQALAGNSAMIWINDRM